MAAELELRASGGDVLQIEGEDADSPPRALLRPAMTHAEVNPVRSSLAKLNVRAATKEPFVRVRKAQYVRHAVRRSARISFSGVMLIALLATAMAAAWYGYRG